MNLATIEKYNNGLPLTAGQLAEILKEFEKGIGAKQADAMNSAAVSIIDFAEGVGQRAKKDAAEKVEASSDTLKAEIKALKDIVPEASLKRVSRLIEDLESAQSLKVNLAIKSIEASVFGVLSHQPKVIVAADDLSNTLTQVATGRA